MIACSNDDPPPLGGGSGSGSDGGSGNSDGSIGSGSGSGAIGATVAFPCVREDEVTALFSAASLDFRSSAATADSDAVQIVYTSASQAFSRSLSDNGTLSSPTTIISSATIFRPVVDAYQDTMLAAYVANVGQGKFVYGQSRSNEGVWADYANVSGTQTTVNRVEVASLGNGSFVVVWSGEPVGNAGSGYTLSRAIIASNGSVVSAASPISIPSDLTGFSVANGGTSATLVYFTGGGANGIVWMRSIDQDGEAGDAIKVAENRSLIGNPSVAPVGDSSFVVWTESTLGGSESHVMVVPNDGDSSESLERLVTPGAQKSSNARVISFGDAVLVAFVGGVADEEGLAVQHWFAHGEAAFDPTLVVQADAENLGAIEIRGSTSQRIVALLWSEIQNATTSVTRLAKLRCAE